MLGIPPPVCKVSILQTTSRDEMSSTERTEWVDEQQSMGTVPDASVGTNSAHLVTKNIYVNIL
jgi:hypothetical protein